MHGIRTTGQWQKVITPAITRASLLYEPLDYDWMGFLTTAVKPVATARVVRKFVAAYETYRHEFERRHVIAHSMGTAGLGRWLLEQPSVRLSRIILLSSLLGRDYPWAAMIAEGRVEAVRNEHCPKDIFVRLAPLIGHGWSGCDGFQCEAPQVRNASYPHVFHGRHLNRAHCESEWLPFLLGQEP